MKNLTTKTQKTIAVLFLKTAVKRILEEKKNVNNITSENDHLGSKIT